MKAIKRATTIQKIDSFCASKGAGIVFIRGRRRVGKTWLLQSLAEKQKSNCFRIVCRKHRRDSVMLQELVHEWSIQSGRTELTKIKTSQLTWKMFFDDIAIHAQTQSKKIQRSFIVIIDEIQWLSTDYAESAAILKATWDDWSKRNTTRILACGSSTRFFAEQFGEGSVLRGIQTHADIYVLPFSLSIIKKEVAKDWNLKETVLAYMCLGGIPYYWQQIPVEKGFRRAMNEALCTQTSIFIDEWKEIIATEFRTDAVRTLSRLFPTLMSGEDGVTEADITTSIGSSNSTIARLLEKLVAYGYVTQSLPNSDLKDGLPTKNFRGTRYVLSDFYLNFYFAILRPMEQEIRLNQSGLLFPSEILQGNEKEYIPNFTGKAFERFVHYHIDTALRDGDWLSNTRKPPLWEKLDLPDLNYRVHWNVLVRGKSSDKVQSQIDILVVHQKEKSVRVIECKWKNTGETSDVEDVRKKTIPQQFQNYTRHNYLVCSYDPTTALRAYASKNDVSLIELKDFL